MGEEESLQQVVVENCLPFSRHVQRLTQDRRAKTQRLLYFPLPWIR